MAMMGQVEGFWKSSFFCGFAAFVAVNKMIYYNIKDCPNFTLNFGFSKQ
jgi:hypothetical protein